MKILIVEDELHLAEALEQILKREHYSIDMVNNGIDGLDYALTDIYDLILLDIMLPKLDGISVLKSLRKNSINTPVIMLTAKGEISDKVYGLDSGADDYLAKPFATQELLARVRAAVRRKGEISHDDHLSVGDIQLNQQSLKLFKADKEVKLTLREYQLFELLIIRKNAITSKEYIIEKLWGFDSEAEHNHVEVYISFLRKKLNFINSNVSINTQRGLGYYLEENKNV